MCWVNGNKMKKIISSTFVLIFFSFSSLYGFFSISQISGPNSYSTILGEVYVPISDKTSVDASYTTSSFPGLPNRISYGAEVHAGTGKGTDAGAGFILSPETSGSRY